MELLIASWRKADIPFTNRAELSTIFNLANLIPLLFIFIKKRIKNDRK